MRKSVLKSLPVLAHHLISNDTTHISVRPSIFEEQCKTLAEQGWTGIGLREAEEFLLNGAPLPKKSFLLTFDDGFLDNYVYAWPIMRKYGHKGVVFAVTERIDQAQREGEGSSADARGRLRPTVEDVWKGRCLQSDLPEVDNLVHSDDYGFQVRRDLFINWDEAREMENSGIMSVAAHSTRHASVFKGPEFEGFIQPGDEPRTFVKTWPESFWGCPAFERTPELASTAFLPNPDMLEDIRNSVPQEKRAALEFFSDPAKVQRLQGIVRRYAGNIGRQETPEEQSARLGKVMEECQSTLSNELGHTVRSFCWPWGVFSEPARAAGRLAGFEVFYTTAIGVNPAGTAASVNRIKVKNRVDSWLLSRLKIYSRPWLGALYVKMRI